MARIMRESSIVKTVDAKLKKELSKREKELGAIAEKLKKKAAKLDKDMPVLAESERTTRQRELAELEQEWKQKRQNVRQDMSQRQSEESAAFSKQLNAALKKVADAEKLDIVIQDAAYFNPKIDVTDKVLAELNN